MISEFGLGFGPRAFYLIFKLHAPVTMKNIGLRSLVWFGPGIQNACWVQVRLGWVWTEAELFYGFSPVWIVSKRLLKSFRDCVSTVMAETEHFQIESGTHERFSTCSGCIRSVHRCAGTLTPLVSSPVCSSVVRCQARVDSVLQQVFIYFGSILQFQKEKLKPASPLPQKTAHSKEHCSSYLQEIRLFTATHFIHRACVLRSVLRNRGEVIYNNSLASLMKYNCSSIIPKERLTHNDSCQPSDLCLPPQHHSLHHHHHHHHHHHRSSLQGFDQITCK